MNFFTAQDDQFQHGPELGKHGLGNERSVFAIADNSYGGLTGLRDLLSESGLPAYYQNADNGLTELVSSLRDNSPYGGYQSVHLLSHGSPGKIEVGSDLLSSDNLFEYSNELAELGSLLSPGGDLLVYGCAAGAGDEGSLFTSGLAKLTGADVATSDDITGVSLHAGLGDWDLEVQVGDIEVAGTNYIDELGWQGSLALPVLGLFAKVLGEAVVGAFAGYAVEQLLTTEDKETKEKNVVLQFPADENGNKPLPVKTGINPGSFTKSALFLDTTGDLVDIRLDGNGDFRLALSGGLSNLADIISLELRGTDKASNLSITVSPIGQSINAGSATSINDQTKAIEVSGLYNRMYSPGYTNIDRIFSSSKNGQIGDIELTATIVNNIDLAGFDINSIELDTGYTTLVDRVNTTTLSSSNGFSNTISGNVITGNKSLDGEIVDFAIIDDNPVINGGLGGAGSSIYQPVTGLIDIGNITADNLEQLIINGSISGATGNPYDPSNTNDIVGTVSIAESIGNISALRSRLSGSIHAGSIDKIDIGRIDGTITTTDTTKQLTVRLPANFGGFINSAGHLNMGYTFYPVIGDPDTNQTPGPTLGRITSFGGISGIFSSEEDPIFVPSGYSAIVRNESANKGVADIRVNGVLSSSWYSKSDIGNISANTITSAATIKAERNIGAVRALRRVLVPADLVDPDAAAPLANNLDGTIHAGASIGNITSAAGIGASIRAISGSIGTITTLSGGISSKLIEAGQDIGLITIQSQSLTAPKIVAQKGDIKGIRVYTGMLDGVIRAGAGEQDQRKKSEHNVEYIYVEKGSLNQLSVEATGSIGEISVKGSNTILGGTFTAGANIGLVTASSSRGTAIKGALFEAGDENGQYIDKDGNVQTSVIRGLNAKSSGTTILSSVEVGMPSVTGRLPSQPSETAAHGIESTQIISGKIGIISATASTGSGIVGVPFKIPRSPDVDITPDDLSEGYTVIHAKVDNIESITGIGNGHGLANVVAVARQSIGALKGTSNMKGNGIEASIINANEGNIASLEGNGGVAGGHGVNDTFLKALGKVGKVSGIVNANEGDALRLVDARAGLFGLIEATVLGGKGGDAQNPRGSGIVQSSFKGYNDTSTEFIATPDSSLGSHKNLFFKDNGIDAVRVDVRSIYGRGIDRSSFSVKGSIGLVNSRSFGNSSIFESEFTVALGTSQLPGDIREIISESQNSGNAIDASSFIVENGSIGNGLAGIAARSGGLNAIDHAISASIFKADNGLGAINASTKGGAAIIGSSFEADANFDNIGDIVSIAAKTSGENLKASSAIKDTSFIAATIQDINAEVADFDGGDTIEGSEFTARTAIYDELTGAINNRGSIGRIKVVNASRIGDGISASNFIAGAAGSIGDIDVDVITRKLSNANPYNRSASGRAIHLSAFRASSLDPDQTVLTGTIGNISVKAGRVEPQLIPDLLLPSNASPPNDQSTLEGAGINASYFASYGGIGRINIDSIGTGVFGSVFLSNADPLNGVPGFIANSVAQERGEGRIQGITINANGLYASGTLLSLFSGSSIGDISVIAKGFPIPNPTAFLQQFQNLSSLNSALQSGQILPIIQAAGVQILDFLASPIPLSSSPVTLTAFIGLRGDIGSINFENSSIFSNYPFLGSLVYAKGSYGAVTTSPTAIKVGSDLLLEGSLAAAGFTDPNVFTIYPLPTTFIGTRRQGGNLPSNPSRS